MPSERMRILELALESLEARKKKIDEEIAALTKQMKRGRAGRAIMKAEVTTSPSKVGRGRKRARFSKEERARRAARMKAYWDKWRKEKARQK